MYIAQPSVAEIDRTRIETTRQRIEQKRETKALAAAGMAESGNLEELTGEREGDGRQERPMVSAPTVEPDRTSDTAAIRDASGDRGSAIDFSA